MNDMSAYLKTASRIALFLLSFCLLGWALFEPYRSYMAGVILGIVVSLVNAYYLSYKIREFTRMIEHNAGRRVNLGFLTRASTAVLAVFAASKTEHIEVVTTAAGIFFVPLSTIVVGLINRSRDS